VRLWYTALGITTRLTANYSQKIYFDGYLPPSKLEVRLERLRGLTKRLNDYYQANPVPCRLAIVAGETDPGYLFARESIRSSLTTLPPNPFLVPAIIDALGRSERYKSLAEVVPGEADLYCARYSKLCGTIIFTGDSDLLIHDLGADGAVSFFKDIEASLDSEPRTLRSLVYHPATIAGRLTLPKPHGLHALAFELVKDSHGTFKKLLAQATTLKAINADECEYVEFSKEYESLPLDLTPDRSEISPRFLEVLQKLDPRISEYVMQFPSLAKCAGRTPTAAKSEMDSRHVFLPFLLDCPARTNAWVVSTSLRQLAYGLIKNIVPEAEQQFDVFEHRRQSNINGKGVQLPNLEDIPEACVALVNLIDKIHLKLPALSLLDRWIAFIVCQDVEWSSSVGRAVLSNCVSQGSLNVDLGPSDSRHCNWDIIQFLAQVQSTFYSLRMLQQIIRLSVFHHDSTSCPEIMTMLHHRLETLPQLGEIPDLRSVASLVGKIRDMSMVKAAYEILGIEDERSPELQESSKRAKKKRRMGEGQTQPSNSKKKLNNPFALLDAE